MIKVYVVTADNGPIIAFKSEDDAHTHLVRIAKGWGMSVSSGSLIVWLHSWPCFDVVLGGYGKHSVTAIPFMEAWHEDQSALGL